MHLTGFLVFSQMENCILNSKNIYFQLQLLGNPNMKSSLVPKRIPYAKVVGSEGWATP